MVAVNVQLDIMERFVTKNVYLGLMEKVAKIRVFVTKKELVTVVQLMESVTACLDTKDQDANR